MSLAREIRSRAALKNEKANGMRRTCRHCKSRMLGKPGYGWICQECGWESLGQRLARRELEAVRDD